MLPSDYEKELTPEVREKMRKNLVYIGIFSVVMLFAGLSSAYIVSAGDTFWVKYNLPSAFYISTTLILLSSVVLIVGIKMAQKQQKPSVLKVAVPLTLILGLGFTVYQFKGYKELTETGAYLSSRIAVTDGKYGSFYELKIDGKFMEVDGNDYLLAGKLMTEQQKNDLSKFAKQFERISKNTAKAPNFYDKYSLVYKNQDVSYRDGKFYIQDTVELATLDIFRLEEFSWHLRDGRGDFFHRGKFGKDFKVFYKGKELQYKDRTLMYEGVPLNAPLQLKMNSSADTASSYLYIITFLHLLHILVTLIVMARATVKAFTGKLEIYNYLPIRTLGVFWHFLGILWVYLLLFLLFIH
jgi:cytochrome c oxidase subunit 3